MLGCWWVGWWVGSGCHPFGFAQSRLLQGLLALTDTRDPARSLGFDDFARERSVVGWDVELLVGGSPLF